mmetsp:Transcript_18467/g.41071  ORF Transcript_18467/g.41071 Transcript_18467/m.41071 type:complete len:125 (+) Transcript_18467:120-494(+)
MTYAQFRSAGTLHLQLLFLRSYNNSGLVSLHLCGQPLRDTMYQPTFLDALWSNYRTFHFSLPEVFHAQLDSGGYCSGGGTGFVPLTLRHTPASTVRTVSAGEREARGGEKFKLLEVQVCRLKLQ